MSLSIFMLAPLFLMASDTAPGATAPASNGSGDMKLICKTMGETGSRLSRKRVCKTKDKWAEDRAQTRAVVDRSQVHQSNQFE